MRSYVDQGGGKRKGAFAIYLEPWHSDVFEFLDLRKNHGKEEARARDLFYGLWVRTAAFWGTPCCWAALGAPVRSLARAGWGQQ